MSFFNGQERTITDLAACSNRRVGSLLPYALTRYLQSVLKADDYFPDCSPDSIRNARRGFVSCHASLDTGRCTIPCGTNHHFANATGPNSQNSSRWGCRKRSHFLSSSDYRDRNCIVFRMRTRRRQGNDSSMSFVIIGARREYNAFNSDSDEKHEDCRLRAGAGNCDASKKRQIETDWSLAAKTALDNRVSRPSSHYQHKFLSSFRARSAAVTVALPVAGPVRICDYAIKTCFDVPI
jgi:hypothetical protein